MRKNTLIFYAKIKELFFLVRIAIQNSSGTLAFGGHLLSPTTSEAKWKGNRLLTPGPAKVLPYNV